MTSFAIETPRLILREWRESDAAEMLTHTNTPQFRRWLGPLIDAETAAATVASQQALQAEHGHCFWVIERREDSAFLGYCGMKRVNAANTDLTGEFEIGWGLRSDAWGSGYAREAAEAALDYGFDVLGMPRVIAFTVIENSASWGLMERLGMTRRPELGFDDPAFSEALNPTIVYSLAKADWKAA